LFFITRLSPTCFQKNILCVRRRDILYSNCTVDCRGKKLREEGRHTHTCSERDEAAIK
jgi:hypothetical protein